MKECLKKETGEELVDIGRSCEIMGDDKLAKRSGSQKVEGKGGEENRECDGRTAAIEIWEKGEENGEQQKR